MADVIDLASSRNRLAELAEKRALRRAQQIAAAELESITIAAADLPALAEYAKPRWPGGIDDLEF